MSALDLIHLCFGLGNGQTRVPDPDLSHRLETAISQP